MSRSVTANLKTKYLVMTKKVIFIILALYTFSSWSYAGGGWPVPKGGFYFKLSEWWLISDRHYTDAGQIDPNITSGIFNTSIYTEYGLTNRLGLVVYFPFLSRAYVNNVVSGTTGDLLIAGDAINTIGDTDIGLKYSLTPQGSIKTAVTLTLGLPLGNSSGGSQQNLQTGDGEFNQMLSFDAGTSFSTKRVTFYTNVMMGVNNRTNDFSDEFRYGLEFGAGFLDRKIWIVGRLTGVESFKNGATAAQVNSTSIFANNSEYTSYGAELSYYLTSKIGFNVGYASAFRGELIFANPSYTVGVFLDFTK